MGQTRRQSHSILIFTAISATGLVVSGCNAINQMTDTTTPPLPVVVPPPVNNWPNVVSSQSMVARSADGEPEPRVSRAPQKSRPYTDQVSREIERRKMEQQRADDIRQQREAESGQPDLTRRAVKSDVVGIGKGSDEAIDWTQATTESTPVAVKSSGIQSSVVQSSAGPIERRSVVVEEDDASRTSQLAPEQTVAASSAVSSAASSAVLTNQTVDTERVARDLTEAAARKQVSVGNLVSATDVTLSDGVGTDFTRSLVARARQQPDDIVAQFDAQLARYLKGQPAPVAAELEHVAPDDREMVSAVIDGLVNFRNQARNNPDALSAERTRPLMEMAGRILAAGELVVNNVTLCSAVKGFGDYQPVEPRFVAGQPSVVVLYSEVDNFTSTQTDAGKWQTKLAYEVRIYTEGGMEVWSERSENVTDLARRKRQDFFVAKMVRLPANLTVGRYSLKVTVRDLQANRVAESALPIQFVARLDNLRPVNLTTVEGQNK